MSALERVRLNFAYRVLHDSGRVLVEGETFHACASGDDKLKRLPEELTKLLRPYYCEPPAA